jgi:hypothetical protein
MVSGTHSVRTGPQPPRSDSGVFAGFWTKLRSGIAAARSAAVSVDERRDRHAPHGDDHSR